MSETMTNIEKKGVSIPKLRFIEFDFDWKRTTISKIAQIIGGGTPDTNDEECWGGEIQWFTPSELKQKYLSTSKRTITKKGLEKSSAKLLPKGTLLFSSRASVGEVSILLNEATTNQGFQSMVVNDSNHSEFIYNWILKNTHEFIKRSSGSTFLEISKTEISKIKLFVPSLPEQQKIASFLSAVDQKIQLLTRKKELLERYKKGVMQQLFSQQIRFKDTDGKEFPEWEEKSLNEITSPIKRTSERIIDNIMTISGANGFMHQEDRFSQVIAANSLSNYTHILKDEFAYNRGNSKSYKYGCIYKMKDKEALIPYVYHCFKLNEGVPGFMEHLFSAKYLDRQLRRLISSSARMDGLLNIGAKEFFKTKVIFPVEEEQQKIAEFIDSIDQRIKQATEQLNQTQIFKKGLLQKMFV